MQEQITGAIAATEDWLGLVTPYGVLPALVIVVLAFTVAKLAEKIIAATAGRLVQRTRTTLDDVLIEGLRRPIFMSLFLAGLGAATHQLTFLSEALTRVTIAALVTIAIFIWLGFGMKLSALVLSAVSTLKGRYDFIQPGTLPLFDNTAKIVLVGAALYFMFLAWGINVSALLASAGIIGLALSFASRDALSNIFGGMSILADRPYVVGDYINLDSGERGEVTHIGLRSTRLLTRDDVEISIPNSVMGNAKIINETGGPHEKFRLRVKVGVAYGSDVDQVEALLVEIATAHSEICATPKPRARFRAFGESSLDFELLAWVPRPVLRGRLQHELNGAVYRGFQSAGVEIPFPQRDVHMKQPAP